MTVVGSLVYATKSGLGNLAKTFYDAKIINKVMITKHPSYDSFNEWYNKEDVEISENVFLEKIDTLFLLEVPLPDPFNWKIVEKARYMGKKICLMPMYESTPRQYLYMVDEILCPSLLDLESYKKFNSQFIQVPSNDDVEWKERKVAHHFIHNVGHGGIFSRNGTIEIINALPLIKSPFKLTIRIQPDASKEILEKIDNINDPRVEVVKQHVPFKDLWSIGDVFLFPEKFNGLSLPLQEAYASGMAVMAGNRFPVNTWLPTEPLIPVSGEFLSHIPWLGIYIKNAVISSEDIAKTIDTWYNQDISHLSRLGKEWKEANSMEQLRLNYLELLSS